LLPVQDIAAKTEDVVPLIELAPKSECCVLGLTSRPPPRTCALLVSQDIAAKTEDVVPLSELVPELKRRLEAAPAAAAARAAAGETAEPPPTPAVAAGEDGPSGAQA
jgi:hypothetical protein